MTSGQVESFGDRRQAAKRIGPSPLKLARDAPDLLMLLRPASLAYRRPQRTSIGEPGKRARGVPGRAVWFARWLRSSRRGMEHGRGGIRGRAQTGPGSPGGPSWTGRADPPHQSEAGVHPGPACSCQACVVWPRPPRYIQQNKTFPPYTYRFARGSKRPPTLDRTVKRSAVPIGRAPWERLR